MKTKILYLVLLVSFPQFSAVFSQNRTLLAEATRVESPRPAPVTDRPASFRELGAYLRDNLIYPEAARKNGVEGIVTAEAIVGRNGQVREVRIVRGLGFGCDEAVKQLIINMPSWEPAIENGSTVSQRVVMNIRFKLK